MICDTVPVLNLETVRVASAHPVIRTVERLVSENLDGSADSTETDCIRGACCVLVWALCPLWVGGHLQAWRLKVDIDRGARDLTCDG